MSNNNKLQQMDDKRKTFEDLLKSIEKDEAKAKKTYDDKMSDILSKKNAFQEQLRAIEKEEAKIQKVFDDKMSEISPKKKTFEETLKSIDKEEAKLKKSSAKIEAKDDSDDDGKKSDSDSEKTKKKKSIPKKIKELVWNNHIGHDIATSMCTCCEKTPIKNTDFHCGHVLAEANGGTLDITNLRPICAGCNLSMGTQNMDDFKKVFGLGKKEKKPVITQKKND
uniref:HNH endonuclease 5 domain-containing protein n=1 Tax=viral metagenome TaxID=1070528 RepID=A0A6C0JM85_9ZZZZ